MTIAIQKTFKVAGVATDVTSWTLGITRSDTGGVVVAAGTAMTRTGIGMYSYTLTPPTSGLTYSITYVITDTSGNVYTLPDTYVDTGVEEVSLPALTGDTLADTLASLRAERLRVARNGPMVSYQCDGQSVNWSQYLSLLDQRIIALRIEISESTPWETVSVVR